MSNQSVAGEVARVQAPAHLIEASLSEFAKLLPAQVTPDRFGRWALTVLKRGLADPRQAEAWARVLHPDNAAGLASVMSALMDAATLGLEPGREYHLVPFGSTVTGITDYKGEIKLITNARKCSVIAQLVCQQDEFAMTGANIPPHHEADWFNEDKRGEVIGGYAYVAYPQGEYSLVVRMSRLEFERHRAKSKTGTRDDSPWVQWYEAMCLKTLVHQQRKWVPWSAERQW